MDLVDFRLSKTVIAKDNDGYNYIVTAIEILSRFAFTSRSKTKAQDVLPDVVAQLLKDFFKRFNRYPKIIQFDEGSEFLNKTMQKLLKDKDIEVWVSGTARKAAVVERFNRTLKEKMVKYFAHTGKSRWVDFLPQLTENYNSQVNRSIGIPPKDVNEQNKHQVWMKLYGAAKGPVLKPKFEVGERVRLLDYKMHKVDVEKWKEEALHDYEANVEMRRQKSGQVLRRRGPALSAKHSARFSEEVFIVSEVRLGYPVTYKLYSDQINDEIIGIFYERELSEYTGGGNLK